MTDINQATKTALSNEVITKILGIIANFDRESGIAAPVRFITEMTYRQFMFLEELEQAGVKGEGFTTRELNSMTYDAHVLINFIIDLLGQYERYERITQR